MRHESTSDGVRHRLFVDVLWRLQEVGALREIVLIGSWCKYFYNDWFHDPEALSPNKTTDIDFLISLPIRLQRTIDVPAAGVAANGLAKFSEGVATVEGGRGRSSYRTL